jgi:hypothetical protein
LSQSLLDIARQSPASQPLPPMWQELAEGLSERLSAGRKGDIVVSKSSYDRDDCRRMRGFCLCLHNIDTTSQHKIIKEYLMAYAYTINAAKQDFFACERAHT